MPKLIHTMIRVRNLEESKRFYCEALGLHESNRMTFPTFSLVYLREPESGFEIELTVNNGQSDPYTHGSGYGHIAFAAENLEKMHQDLTSQGFAPGPLKELTASGANARFFFVTDPDGYKIEILHRSGHYV